MTLAERESSFIERIDARFPYNDPASATALIHEALSISPNMAFAVLEEICRPPRHTPVLKSRQLELLNEWHAAFSHALSNPITECALSLIHGQRIPIGWLLKLMDEIAQHHQLYAALNIAYYAAGRLDVDDVKLAEKRDEDIRKAWNSITD